MTEEPNYLPTGPLATVIAEALQRQGRGSKAALAASLGVTPSSVSRWATGEDTPDMTRWPRIEEVLNLDAGTFARALGISDTEVSLRQELSDLSAKVDMLQAAVEQLEAHLGRGLGGDTGDKRKRRRSTD
jgi:transcriptional regulator with XRE-family HTH domain